MYAKVIRREGSSSFAPIGVLVVVDGVVSTEVSEDLGFTIAAGRGDDASSCGFCELN